MGGGEGGEGRGDILRDGEVEVARRIGDEKEKKKQQTITKSSQTTCETFPNKQHLPPSTNHNPLIVIPILTPLRTLPLPSPTLHPLQSRHQFV